MRLCLILLNVPFLIAQTGVITSVVGGVPSGDGGPPNQISYVTTGSVAVACDSKGVLYWTERARIRKLGTDGIVVTVVGDGVPASTPDGGLAAESRINLPTGLAVGPDDILYFSEANSHRVRRISSDGRLETVVGTGIAGFGGDDVLAKGAAINFPLAVAVDAIGNIYFADNGNRRTRKVDTNGTLTTVATSPNPRSVAVDGNGRVFVTDSTLQQLFVIDTDGAVTTLASQNNPWGVAVSPENQVYYATNNGFQVLRLDENGESIPVAGIRVQPGFSGNGGPALEAKLATARSIAFDRNQNMYIAELWGNGIRRVNANGVIEQVVTSPASESTGGPAAFARLLLPAGVAVSAEGDLYITDSSARSILKRNARGNVEILVPPNISTARFEIDPRPISELQLFTPGPIAVDRSGFVYASDTRYSARGQVIFKISPTDRTYSLFAGFGETADVNEGPAVNARLGQIYSLCFDAEDNLYLAERDTNRIRKITPDGMITTIAGSGGRGYAGDNGPATAALLNNPEGVAVDRQGNIYIADTANQRIRRVDPSGTIVTIAGRGNPNDRGDGGRALDADLFVPVALAVGRLGELYVQQNNFRVRVITPDGQIGPFAGTGEGGYSGDGSSAIRAKITGGHREFIGGDSLAVDTNGTVYLADSHNGRVRKIEGRQPFSANPPGFVFASWVGAPAQSEFFDLRADSETGREFRISSNRPWLIATPAEGLVLANPSTQIRLTANPAGLPRGTYSGQLSISDPLEGKPLIVPVTMLVGGSQQQLKLSQTGFALTAPTGTSTPLPPQTLRILNTGAGVLRWTASTSVTDTGGRWLTVTPASGITDAAAASPPSVQVNVNPTGLAPGVYFGLVTITAPGVDNSPQSATVVLSITPANQTSGPVVEPAGLLFTGAPASPDPAAQNLQLANPTNRAVTYAATVTFPDRNNWVTIPVPNGSVNPGQSISLEIRPRIGQLAAGVYNATVSVRFQPDNITRTANLSLVLARGGTGANKLPAADGLCTPTKLVPVIQFPSIGFNVTAAWPTPIQVKIADDCTNLLTTGQVVASFSSNDPPVALTHNSGGVWTGTWAARNAQNAVSISVGAATFNPKLEGSATQAGRVNANANQPVILPGGVRNAASLREGDPIGLGSQMAVLGSRLASDPVTVESAKNWPVQLGQTSVLIAGRPAPLRSVADGRVAALVPLGTPDNARQQLIVRRGTSVSVPETVLIATQQPAVFTADESGSGRALAYLVNPEDGALTAVDEGRPLLAGEVLLIRATGLGPVSFPPVDGAVAVADPPSRVMSEVKASIQGVECVVIEAVLAPGEVGVYLVKLRVPEGLKPDSSAILLLSAGGQECPPVTVAVSTKE